MASNNGVSKLMVARLRAANERLKKINSIVGTTVYVWPSRGESSEAIVLDVKQVGRDWMVFVRCKGIVRIVHLESVIAKCS